MSGYFYALLLTSVCGGLCSLLSDGVFEKYIKYIASLVCILLMLLPFKSIDTDALYPQEEISVSEGENEDLLYKTAAKLTEQEAEAYITEIVFNKFGINPDCCNIKIDWEQETPTIQSITVAITNADGGKGQEIKDYLQEILGGEVLIVEE